MNELLSHFSPTLLILTGIATVVLSTLAIQRYINSQIRPTSKLTKENSILISDLKLESRISAERQTQQWDIVRAALEKSTDKLSELTIGQAEMKVALFGHDGSNGIRGELRALRQDVKDISTRVGSLERE